MSESKAGTIVITRDIFPSEYHLSIRGNGRSTLKVANETREIGAEHPLAGPLLATLHEVVKHEFPNSDLLDAGPGPAALGVRALELKEFCDRAVEAHQAQALEIAELTQRVAEADAANERLTRELTEERETSRRYAERNLGLREALGMIEAKETP
jgi:hypothetical protein